MNVEEVFEREREIEGTMKTVKTQISKW